LPMSAFCQDAHPDISLLSFEVEQHRSFAVGQVWLRMVNEIRADLFWFTLILHFFAHSLTVLMLSWSFTEVFAMSSLIASIAVSTANVAVVFSDVGTCVAKI
jgi:hypothetical protein